MNKMAWRKIGPLFCLGFFMSSAPALAGYLEDQLFAAVDGARPEEVQDAIHRGADVNARDEKGHTPLYWAKSEQALGCSLDDNDCWARYDSIIDLLEAAGGRDE
jgi:ankyrin repeat protein